MQQNKCPIFTISFVFSILCLTSVPAIALSSQSPVDIRGDNTVFSALPPLQFDYSSNTTLSVINTGSPGEEATIRANVSPGAGSLTIGGQTYSLLQFHFHSDSEHTINGVSSPMELHLVHRAANGDLAVVGRLIEEGPENPLLAAIFDNLPATTSDTLTVNNFALSGLLPSDLESFRYSGSLTTPPFTEGVAWNVLAAPLTLSLAQIDAFRALFPDGDSRDVQALNGRVILTDVANFSTIDEPGMLMLFGGGLLCACGISRRRRAPAA